MLLSMVEPLAGCGGLQSPEAFKAALILSVICCYVRDGDNYFHREQISTDSPPSVASCTKKQKHHCAAQCGRRKAFGPRYYGWTRGTREGAVF